MQGLAKYVRSFANGRARIRHPAVCTMAAEDIAAVTEAVTAVEGIDSVEFNSVTGSVLLTWDPLVLTLEDLKSHLSFWLAALGEENSTESEEGCAEKCTCASCEDLEKLAEPIKKAGQSALDSAAKILVPGIKNVRRARRMAQNRVMLGLGMASVASLAFGKGAHGMLGWGFVAFILFHLYRYRKVL